MAVSQERLKEILDNEKTMGQEDWLVFFESLTEEEQNAYIMADSGQPRG
jgi:trans-2-enoyl-CoA reductase